MLLTIPSNPEKGEFQTYTLNVTDLIALIDSEYYENQENWRKVIVAYKSITGNQLNLLSFIPDGIATTLTKQGYFAPECFSIFSIQTISIIDKQNGTYILNNNQIPDVGSYNIIFTAATSSFYDMTANYGANIDVSDDGQYIAVQTSYTSNYGAKFYYSFVMNNLTAEIDDELTSLVNFFNVSAYWFNEDNTKVYVAGDLRGTYLGETLPPIPVGPTYSAYPSRVVSVDVATGEVTYITTIEDLGPYNSFSSNTYRLIADEAENVVVVVGLSAIAGYDITTGSRLWFKSITFPSDYPGYRRLELFDPGFFLIGTCPTYDGVSFDRLSPIKINILTGDRDLSFPLAPKDGVDGNNYPWSLTPDKTKIVQAGYFSNSNFTVYSGGSWSPFITAGAGVGYFVAISTSDTHIFTIAGQGGKKMDFNGVVDPGYSLGVPFFHTFNFIQAAGNNVYADFGKFNSTTGSYDTNFFVSGSYYYLGYFNNDRVYYMTSANPNIRPDNPAIFDASNGFYPGYAAIINTTTREKVISFPADWTNPTFSFGPRFGLNGTNRVFIGNITPSYFKAYNILTGLVDSSYPTINSATQNIGGYDRDGDYMYLACYSDGANTFNVTDSSGTYNLVTKMMRFNIATKLVDQTFLPVITGPFGDQFQAFSFTDNYIYISCGYSIYLGPSGAYFYRINRATQAVEEITPADFGVSSPTTFNTFTRVRVQQLATNKIMIYVDYTNLLLDGRPYVICDEDTLTQTGLQPDVITQYPRFCAYNAVNNELGGIFLDIPANRWYFMTYNLSNNAKSIVTTAANGYEVSYGYASGDLLNTGNSLNITSLGNAYVMFLNGVYNSNFKPYGGIIRMNPIGIVNNE